MTNVRYKIKNVSDLPIQHTLENYGINNNQHDLIKEIFVAAKANNISKVLDVIIKSSYCKACEYWKKKKARVSLKSGAAVNM